MGIVSLLGNTWPLQSVLHVGRTFILGPGAFRMLHTPLRCKEFVVASVPPLHPQQVADVNLSDEAAAKADRRMGRLWLQADLPPVQLPKPHGWIEPIIQPGGHSRDIVRHERVAPLDLSSACR